jgi:rubrerythrin
LSEQAENEQLKKVCHLQAEKEREHLEMLEKIYFFVEEPRTYLEWGEFSNLKSL